MAIFRDVATMALTASGELNGTSAGVLSATSVQTPCMETYFPLTIVLGNRKNAPGPDK